jgi:hypothetical protein
MLKPQLVLVLVVQLHLLKLRYKVKEILLQL